MINMNEISFDKDEFKRQMGNRLLNLRLLQGMSLEEVSDEIGVTAQQIHKHEIGETTVSPIHLYKYAKLFKVSIGHFFGESGEDSNNGYKIDRKVLIIASEIVSLHDDIRIGIYHLAKQINKINCVSIKKDKAA